MLELEYIPLKTPDGAICGHARVRGGFVELSLRSPMHASALVITENGSADGAIGKRIPVSAQVSAIALHENEVLRCCGFSRTTALKPTDLRRRLQAMAPAKPSGAEPARPAARPTVPPPEAPVSAAFVEEIAAGIPHFAPAARPAEKPSASAMPDADSQNATRARAASVYKRLGDAVPAAAYAPPAPPPPAPPPSPAKSPRQQSAKAPAPSRPAPKAAKPGPRTPWPPPPPPPPEPPQPRPDGHVPQPPPPPQPGPNGHVPPPPEPNPPRPDPHEPWPPPPFPRPDPPHPGHNGHTPSPEPPHHHPDGGHEPPLRAADWGRDAGADPLDAKPAPVPNPFPHIFPDAQFIRAGNDDTLLGEWVHGNSRAEISAVPGPYSPQPPPHLAGYTRYIRARSGGYWVKVVER